MIYYFWFFSDWAEEKGPRGIKEALPLGIIDFLRWVVEFICLTSGLNPLPCI